VPGVGLTSFCISGNPPPCFADVRGKLRQRQLCTRCYFPIVCFLSLHSLLPFPVILGRVVLYDMELVLQV
jgi:hypothetical protein